MQVTFNYTWRLTDYCYSELSNFVECADSIVDPINRETRIEKLATQTSLRDRYIAFLEDLTSRKVKKATPIDIDVLATFILDLENRAQIDYVEGHWDDEPSIVAGGKRFLQRAHKLRAIHADNLAAH